MASFSARTVRHSLVVALVLLAGCDGGTEAGSDAGSPGIDASGGADASRMDGTTVTHRDAEVLVDAAAVDAAPDAEVPTDDAGGDTPDGGSPPCTDDPACDDGDPCTDDHCLLGGCTHAAVDVDMDGFGAGEVGIFMCGLGTDCDDSDPSIYPGATETCDGLDNDCDAFVDEDCECTPGATETCVTSCASAGTRQCAPDYRWGTCAPGEELCNGLDDDCDGAADETFTCPRGTTNSCTTSCGSTGSSACNGGCEWDACVPPIETCNGADDDCDGFVDQTFACPFGFAESCASSCGSAGSRVCAATCTWDACAPPAETCNGRDDDCDGARDEDFPCVLGAATACMTACGSNGTALCDASSCTPGTCTAPPEVCNGADDNCDGAVDETFACARGVSDPCVTSCGSAGTRTCGPTCAWSGCVPPPEICNGLDDDCDRVADDEFTCAMGSTRSCVASCGTTGVQTCDGSCAWGACTPPPEVCNRRDDDCDGAPDNGFACVQYSTGACTTACGTTGTQSCSVSCAWGTCIGRGDTTCDGVDDDCNGVIDDRGTCAGGRVCVAGACRSTPASCTGYRYGGHGYAVCTVNETWADAQSLCAVYGGHLVTVTSSGEQGFLASVVTGRSWHGLYRPSSTCDWQWVTGEPINYTAWDPGQPSSACGDQDCGDFWYGPGWTWDDYWCTSTARVVCEWDS